MTLLQEGQNNEKFDSHPHESEALPSYLMVHNKFYYNLDLFTSILLLALALTEDPAVPAFKVCNCFFTSRLMISFVEIINFHLHFYSHTVTSLYSRTY